MKVIQTMVDFFWYDVDARDLNWTDYFKIFGMYAFFPLGALFMAFYITW